MTLAPRSVAAQWTPPPPPPGSADAPLNSRTPGYLSIIKIMSQKFGSLANISSPCSQLHPTPTQGTLTVPVDIRFSQVCTDSASAPFEVNFNRRNHTNCPRRLPVRRSVHDRRTETGEQCICARSRCTHTAGRRWRPVVRRQDTDHTRRTSTM